MLQSQRQKSSFPQQQLSYFVYGGHEQLQKFLNLQKQVSNDAILRFDPSNIQKSRSFNMLLHAQKLLRYHQLFPFNYLNKHRQGLFFSEQMPLTLHFYMFLITLDNLCSEKQQKIFLEPARKGQILGCYAQTQLAHGSDVQSLMTTAIYNIQQETFTIHSPSVEAVKWWIGDLGVYATHAIVFAQLIIRNKKYGVHAFLVPIRDSNHKLIEGVEAGDVGPKYGYNNRDNGYVKFTNYQIPRLNMLNKYAKVDKNGSYNRRGNEKISYATMLLIRSFIPFVSFYGISKAATILTRYSLVRTQFKDSNGKQIPILNYQIQQDKVIPRIAQSFAILLGSQRIEEISEEVFVQAKKGVFTRLNESHAITSGAKAIFTMEVLKGIQILRRAAGGHGFLMYSGLPGLIQQFSPTVTYEGQNTILLLQVARFLLKSVKHLKEGKRLPPSVMYLEQSNNSDKFTLNCTSSNQLRDPEIIRKIYLYHSCARTRIAGEKITKGLSRNLGIKQAWDTFANLDLVQAGIAHTYFWIYQNFYEKIYQKTQNQKVRKVLTKLLLLYGINQILEKSNSFYQTEVINSSTLRSCQQLKQQLLAQLRPQALSIVQSFQYDDNTLHSAIGCADGKPYERLLDWSMNKNQMNLQENRQAIIQEINKAKLLMKPKF